MKAKTSCIRILYVITTVGLSASPIHLASAEDCPQGKWLKVLTNLEWTMNNADAHKCAVDEVINDGKTASDAFKDCNHSTNKDIDDAGKQFDDCGAEVCNWLKTRNPPWDPAC